jgi:hypothetical protein
MASVAYRGKVEERYQAKSLIEALKLCRADGRTHFLLHDPLVHRRHRDLRGMSRLKMAGFQQSY